MVHDVLTETEKAALLTTLDSVMSILKDGKNFIPSQSTLGSVFDKYDSPDSKGAIYYIHNNSIPMAQMEISTAPDPLDYSEDRSNVSIVPVSFRVTFYYSLKNIERSELESRLSLEKFWIDSDGVKHEGNSLPSLLPDSRLHSYRYRAKAADDRGFDVNVEIFYIDPRDNVAAKPKLDSIAIRRAYPYLTPEMRKQKRDEEREKKREKYGYMNLCTGAICPETGIWEGWTENGPTDVLRVEKGRKFDMVRTVSIAQSTAPCPMIAGRWMWLCALDEQAGRTWNGMSLNG